LCKWLLPHILSVCIDHMAAWCHYFLFTLMKDPRDEEFVECTFTSS
jgi:hypothetical protein